MESLDYYSTSNTLNTFMTALFGAAAGVVAVISALIGIALYLLLAYAYYRMAKNRELPHAWTAWIPIILAALKFPTPMFCCPSALFWYRQSPLFRL